MNSRKNIFKIITKKLKNQYIHSPQNIKITIKAFRLKCFSVLAGRISFAVSKSGNKFQFPYITVIRRNPAFLSSHVMTLTEDVICLLKKHVFARLPDFFCCSTEIFMRNVLPFPPLARV